MNPEAQSELDRILALQPAELSEAEAGFLRARRSYLNEEQRTVFAEVLAAGEPVAEAPAEEESVEASASSRRSRKA
jgi:hypothetical protein